MTGVWWNSHHMNVIFPHFVEESQIINVALCESMIKRGF